MYFCSLLPFFRFMYSQGRNIFLIHFSGWTHSGTAKKGWRWYIKIDIKLGTVYKADDTEKCFLSDEAPATKNMTVKKAPYIKTHISRRRTVRGGGLNEHITHVEKCALLRIINWFHIRFLFTFFSSQLGGVHYNFVISINVFFMVGIIKGWCHCYIYQFIAELENFLL